MDIFGRMDYACQTDFNLFALMEFCAREKAAVQVRDIVDEFSWPRSSVSIRCR
jgi:hypothetical protein